MAIAVLFVAVTSGQGIRVHMEIGNSFGCCFTFNIFITSLFFFSVPFDFFISCPISLLHKLALLRQKVIGV